MKKPILLDVSQTIPNNSPIEERNLEHFLHLHGKIFLLRTTGLLELHINYFFGQNIEVEIVYLKLKSIRIVIIAVSLKYHIIVFIVGGLIVTLFAQSNEYDTFIKVRFILYVYIEMLLPDSVNPVLLPMIVYIS